MICIHKKFCDSYGQQVPVEKIWQHLNTMYNMKALVWSSSLYAIVKTSYFIYQYGQCMNTDIVSNTFFYRMVEGICKVLLYLVCCGLL